MKVQFVSSFPSEGNSDLMEMYPLVLLLFSDEAEITNEVGTVQDLKDGIKPDTKYCITIEEIEPIATVGNEICLHRWQKAKNAQFDNEVECSLCGAYGVKFVQGVRLI
jgi:hypothetical protein